MVTKTEGFHPAEFLLSEGAGSISRETALLTSGQSVLDGQVLKFTAGKLVAAVGTHDSDGETTEDLAGVVVGNHVVSADTPVVYIARMAELKSSALKLHTTVGGGAAAATASIVAWLATKMLVRR